jgi:telomere length regulation protein
MDDISCKAIDKQRDPGIRELPQLSRERRLRIRKSPEIVEVVSTRTMSQISRPLQRPAVCFTDIAAEYFLAPLINRFWQFLRDEQSREQRTSHRQGRQSYRGAGTGLILNPLVLSQFLRTVAILAHASQNAPEWLAIIAVNALELAVTIGTQPMSRTETELEWNHDTELGVRGQDASVLTAALELALVVLDGSHEVDGGKLLGLEHTTILLGTGEWAGKVFSALEKGIKAEGGGGVHEVKLRRAAVGVLLKVDEITSIWKRSMLDTR